MPDDKHNLLQIHDLTATLHAEPDSPASHLLARAKVLQYAATLPVPAAAILAPDSFVQQLRTDITAKSNPQITSEPTHSFDGQTAGQLNAFLDTLPNTGTTRKIHILSKTIQVNESVRLRSHTILQGCGTTFHAENVEIAFLGQTVEDFTLSNLTIIAAKTCAIMLKACRAGHLSNLLVSDGRDSGVVLRSQCRYIKIDSCRFLNNTRAGLIIEDGSHHVHVNHCEAAGSKHSSNWAAGIVLSALRPASEYGIRDAFEPNYFYPTDLAFKADAVPHQNIVEACHIHHNQSSGLYIDGGNGNVVLDNIITDNDKEGLCLDFYAASNLVQGNIIRGNGFRRHQSDDDLRIDMILACGRLADGSAVAKVPNISLDNAASNVLIHNIITDGAGGGIKIVRSGFRNIFGLNTLVDNNSGGNRVFTFPGILLGSAGAEMEGDTSGLDRTGSFENVIFSNLISGNHSVGILFDPHSTYNDARRNLVTQQAGPPMVMLAHPNATAENSFDQTPVSPLRSRLWNYTRILKILFSRFLWCWIGLAIGIQNPAIAEPQQGPRLIINTTDLYFPCQDGGDNFDMIAPYSLDEVNQILVVLDGNHHLRDPAAASRATICNDKSNNPRDPGLIAIAQLDYLYARHTPWCIGPWTSLTNDTDDLRWIPAREQVGIETFLETLRKAPRPVHVTVFGSSRIIAAALNREPELLRRKIEMIHFSAGSATPPGGNFLEWNIGLDQYAARRLLASDLPITIYPCATEEGPFVTRRHNGFWRLPNLNFIDRMDPRLRSYLVYQLAPSSRLDFLRAIEADPDPALLAKVKGKAHFVWETCVWLNISGRKLVHRAEGTYRIVKPGDLRSSDVELPNRLIPCKLTLRDGSKLCRPWPGQPPSVSDIGLFDWSPDNQSTNRWMYDRGNAEENERALQDALPELYISFRPASD